MSQQVKQFHQLVLNNTALRERLKVATDQATLVSMIVQLGNELGYSFTSAEAESYINKNLFTLLRQFS